MNKNTIQLSSISYVLFASPTSAPLWLLVRLYVGWQWLTAGYEKIMSPEWFGFSAGNQLNGYIQGAIAKTGGAHPSVQDWYAAFLQGAVLPNIVTWSNAIALGELLVGLGLIVGLFTGVAAFFGFFMNVNYLLAGTVSTNPILLVLALPLVLAWRVAGNLGLDRYALPALRHASFLRVFRR